MLGCMYAHMYIYVYLIFYIYMCVYAGGVHSAYHQEVVQGQQRQDNLNE
jgi:hypothetical protein